MQTQPQLIWSQLFYYVAPGLPGDITLILASEGRLVNAAKTARPLLSY